MSFPSFVKNNLLQVFLGRSSANLVHLQSIQDLPVLFVVYNEERQWQQYMKELLTVNPDLVSDHLVLRVRSRATIESSGAQQFSSWTELSDWLHTRTKRKSASGQQPTLLLIDELFRLEITRTKKAAIRFAGLLHAAARANIFLVIGTVHLYKGLLNQWFAWLEKEGRGHSRSALDYPELVINDDELYFFRPAGRMVYERRF